ncbi:hypothetical protein ACFW6K_14830 [Streptomyces sp. NPDC058733]|uniref:hypothetical protein n=1 Tax=Streptomyces sp. NPDC058733 TaxID=3346614 RepID=UPI0036995285
MAPPPDDFPQPPPTCPERSPAGRDRGLRRVRLLTRWVAAGAVAGAAALGGLYTHLLPGGQTAQAPAGPAGPAVSSPTGASGDDGGSASGHEDDAGEGAAAPAAPQAPVAPPTTTTQQPHTTTGAS